MDNKFRQFGVLAVVITLIYAVIFAVLQQNYRLSANDPQVQLSESIASMLNNKQDLTPFIPEKQADLSKSLAAFVIVYDSNMEPKISSAMLNGETPEIPRGVLENANQNGQNRVTWQPQSGVRIATVVTKYEGGYVLAGRSLREIETRIDILQKQIILGWVVTLVGAFLSVWFLTSKKSH